MHAGAWTKQLEAGALLSSCANHKVQTVAFLKTVSGAELLTQAML